MSTASLFDDPEEAKALPTPPPPKKFPPVAKISVQDYEAVCAAANKLTVPGFRDWLRARGLHVARCPANCLPFCRGWHVADDNDRG